MQSSSPERRLALLAPALAVTLALTTPLAARAQSDSVEADGVGVARISVIQGNVGIQRGDSAGSLAAVVNAPVLGGDYVTTGDGSRTEIAFDGSTRMRIDGDAQLRFTQLDTSSRTLQLAQGTIELRLLRSTDGDSEIDTPSISIKPQSRGAYRVTVTGDGKTYVTVRSGQAEIDTPQGAQTLGSGSTLVASGSADTPAITTIASIGPDDFDRFNGDRDRLETRAFAAADSAYVNTDIGGVEDLDTYGHWVSDGDYGHVWVPASVGTDWAPYRDGRWVWEDGYGWTWVASEPWGWAPYHYGSWYHSANYGWCWYPPQPRVYTPWRPALVAFIGFGAGAGLSIGFGGGPAFGNIGWVPLAPHEAYHPWWGNSYGSGGNTTIVNNVTNITNVTNVNVYRNVQYNAVSSVTSQRFLQGNFGHNSPVPAAQLQRAQVFRNALPVVPTASNLRFADGGARPPVAVRPALAQRAFAGKADIVQRRSFADQRVALANVTHAPLTPLHFENARTTPIATQHLAPSATGVNGSTAPVIRPAYAAPAHAAPAHTITGTDPWARFNESRSIETEPRRVPGSAAAAVAPTERSDYHQPEVIDGSHTVPAAGPDRIPATNYSHHQSGTVTPYRAPVDGTDHDPATTRGRPESPLSNPQAVSRRHFDAVTAPRSVHTQTLPVETERATTERARPDASHAHPETSHGAPQSHTEHTEHSGHAEHPPAHERG